MRTIFSGLVLALCIAQLSATQVDPRWKGQPAKWKIADGYMEVVPHSGAVHTRQPFGDCQLHVEFAEPVPPVGEDQGRGNSGVFLMGLYEIQVLDSYHSKTYADG
jgi:hypothetical protein